MVWHRTRARVCPTGKTVWFTAPPNPSQNWFSNVDEAHDAGKTLPQLPRLGWLQAKQRVSIGCWVRRRCSGRNTTKKTARMHSWTHGGWRPNRIGGDPIYFDLIKRPCEEKQFTDFFFRVFFLLYRFGELRVFTFILFSFHFIFSRFFYLLARVEWAGCHVTVRSAGCVSGWRLEGHGCRVFILCSVWSGAGNGSVRACGLPPPSPPPRRISCQDDFNISYFVIDGQQFIGESPAVWVWVWVDATPLSASQLLGSFPKRA